MSGLRLFVIGIGVEMLGIGIFVLWPNPPLFAPLFFVVVGGVLILWGIVPGGVAAIARRVWWPGKRRSVSTTTRHGVTMTARLRWSDGVGKPLVCVSDGTIRSIWAALDIEVRNRQQEPKRISDLFLEVKTGRFPRRLIATADPSAINGDLDWYQRSQPRRVEWLLEPNAAAIAHHVRFARGWPEDSAGPRDPQRFSATIVAELGGEDRQIRLDLAEDIMSVPNYE